MAGTLVVEANWLDNLWRFIRFSESTRTREAIRMERLSASQLRIVIVPGSIKGKVIEIDASGSLITDIRTAQLASAPRDASVRITVDEHETFGIFVGDHGQPSMTLIATLDGEESPLKIQLVDDSASAMLGVRTGAPVEVIW
jgi:S-adenosylmethionine hydrolase